MIGTQFFHKVLNILDRQVHLWCGLDQCGHSVLLPRMVQGQHYTTFRILVVVLAEPMSEVFELTARPWTYTALIPEVLRTTQLPLPARTALNSLPETAYTRV